VTTSRGDGARELNDRYSVRIFRFVRSRILDDGLAEDVTTDVIYRAVQRLRAEFVTEPIPA